MLTLLVSSFFPYTVAKYVKDLPIYEALLERDLALGGVVQSHGKPIVREFEIAADSPFAWKALRDLGLPAGCVLVRCALDGLEWVPTADTPLAAHLRSTAVIAPEATNALARLRQGCASAGNSVTKE